MRNVCLLVMQDTCATFDCHRNTLKHKGVSFGYEVTSSSHLLTSKTQQVIQITAEASGLRSMTHLLLLKPVQQSRLLDLLMPDKKTAIRQHVMSAHVYLLAYPRETHNKYSDFAFQRHEI